MSPEHKPSFSAFAPKTEKHVVRLPVGVRKHIRRLKQEGNFKEAAILRNTEIDNKNRAAVPKIVDEAD